MLKKKKEEKVPEEKKVEGIAFELSKEHIVNGRHFAKGPHALELPEDADEKKKLIELVEGLLGRDGQ